MAEQIILVGSDPSDDYSTITAAFVALTASAANINTTQTRMRIRGPNSNGPATYSVNGLTFRNVSGGATTLIRLEAFDPTDKPVIDGSSSGQLGFNAYQGYNSSAPASWTNGFENIIFQNWSVNTSTSTGVIYGGRAGLEVVDCEFDNVSSGRQSTTLSLKL